MSAIFCSNGNDKSNGGSKKSFLGLSEFSRSCEPNGWSREESEKSRVSRKYLSTQNRKALIKAWGVRCGCCRCEIIMEKYEDFSESYMCDVDHFIPLRHGGKNDYDNLWPICGNCHRYKSTQESKIIHEKSRNFCILCKNWGSHHLSCFAKHREKFFNSKIFDIFRTDDYFTTNHLSSSDAEFPVIDAENRFKKYEYLGD